MEGREMIGTRRMKTTSGKQLRMDYYLLGEFDEVQRAMKPPYGMEIVLTGHNTASMERCRNLTRNYQYAVKLIRRFTEGGVTPACMLGILEEKP